MDISYPVPSIAIVIVICTFVGHIIMRCSEYMYPPTPPLSPVESPLGAHNPPSSSLPSNTSMVAPTPLPAPAPFVSPLTRSLCAEDLQFDDLKLDKDGCVLIMRNQYAFFTRDDGLGIPVEQQDGLCHVKLMEFAGMVSLMAHCEDAMHFHALTKSLLVRLQELARPERTMTASRYREEQIVKLFGRAVVYHDIGRNLKRAGVLQGIVGRTTCYYNKMRICGSDTWEVVASLQSLAEATIVVYEEKADEDKAGEWVNCVGDDDKSIIAG